MAAQSRQPPQPQQMPVSPAAHSPALSAFQLLPAQARGELTPALSLGAAEGEAARQQHQRSQQPHHDVQGRDPPHVRVGSQAPQGVSEAGGADRQARFSGIDGMVSLPEGARGFVCSTSCEHAHACVYVCMHGAAVAAAVPAPIKSAVLHLLLTCCYHSASRRRPPPSLQASHLRRGMTFCMVTSSSSKWQVSRGEMTRQNT